MGRRRFKNAGEAAAELFSGFNDWSAILTKHSIEAALAVVAANWAVHGTAGALLRNGWSKWSMAVAIAFLGLNLLLTGLMASRYNKQTGYADHDKDRWEREYEKAAGKASVWPYTRFIEVLGCVLRGLKVFVPLIAALLFVVSLFHGDTGHESQSVGNSSAPVRESARGDQASFGTSVARCISSTKC